MHLQKSVPLSTLTTLHAGGVADAVAICKDTKEIREALAYARTHGMRWYVLGDGSNVLADDAGYRGLIIQPRIEGISFSQEGDTTVLRAGAGVNWDDAVKAVAARGLWGIENLAGIPGTCGAAPVQNIGAYGAELSQVLVEVEVLDARSGEVLALGAQECALGYRDSRFKHEPSLIIIAVSLRLAAAGSVRADYSDLKAAREAGADLSTPKAVGAAVRAIRSKKFPDLAIAGTAGSFFKNPILTFAQYEALTARYGDVPQFPHPHGIKIPLAFILDKVLSLRGFRMGHAHLFGAQPLVLVLDEGGTASEVDALAQEIEMRVFNATGIKIEREVRTLSFS